MGQSQVMGTPLGGVPSLAVSVPGLEIKAVRFRIHWSASRGLRCLQRLNPDEAREGGRDLPSEVVLDPEQVVQLSLIDL